jgi:hypothetical protein
MKGASFAGEMIGVSSGMANKKSSKERLGADRIHQGSKLDILVTGNKKSPAVELSMRGPQGFLLREVLFPDLRKRQPN